MQADTIVVVTQSAAESRDPLPLWTGLLGGILGLAATFWSSSNSRSATREQIVAQREIAKEQLREQAVATRLQLQATIVSANRIRWIDSLRTEVAAFSGAVIAIATDVSSGVKAEAVYHKIDTANHHATLLELLLDDEHQDCRNLMGEVDQICEMVSSFMPPRRAPVPHDEVDVHIARICQLTRAIAKSEWNRVAIF